MSKKPLNVNDCKITLRDVYNSNKVISIDKIQTVTSNFFSISLNDMLSPRRSRPLARPRQIAMYFAKKLPQGHYLKLEENLRIEITLP